jgi:hypothetical protein
MTGLEIFWIGVALIAAWHGLRHGTPRAFRAVGKRRQASVAKWQADHPSAPKSARWLRGMGFGLTAALWGPKHMKREFAGAWREGWDRGKAKYRPERSAEPVRTADGLRFGDDPTDPTGVRLCPECRGSGLRDGAPCPSCVNRQGQRNADAALHRSTCSGCGATSGPADKATVEAWKDAHTCPPEPQRRPDGRPDLRPVPDATPAPTRATTRSNDMAVQTATGGEVTNAEQFAAEAKAIEAEAAADLEDARGDATRAEEDLGRIEKMIASLSKQAAVSRDIAAVAALKEPAAARAGAAKDRHGAAERRLAVAKNVSAIAAKHVQMIGQAAGPFYNPRG